MTYRPDWQPRRITKRTPLMDRFWAKVRKTDTCWLWTGCTRYGYGLIGSGGTFGRMVLTHRLSWELHRGPIEDGLFVLHKCDIRACVNPDHLFLGTQDDNIKDMDSKARRRTVSPRGDKNPRAKLTEAQATEIIALSKQGTSERKLAERFRVSRAAIRFVLSGRTWKCVQEQPRGTADKAQLLRSA